MKRFLQKFLFLFLILTTTLSFSQVANYTFSETVGTYTPIVGGTNYNNFTNWTNGVYIGTLSNTTLGYLDDNLSSSLLPIGFNFTYNGTTYSQFGICTNGWISLGSLPINSWTPLSTGTSNDVISAMGGDLIGRGSFLANRSNNSNVITITSGDINLISVGDKVSGSGIPANATVISKGTNTVTISANATSGGSGFHFRFSSPNFGIRYETIGTAPNRTLVIQWTGWQRFTTSGSFGELYDFQIRLHETTNTVSMVYDLKGPTSTTSTTFQIGLRGSTSGDFNNRSTTTDWVSTTNGTSNTATITLRSSVKPTSGLTFIWTPPGLSNDDCINATSLPCATTNLAGSTINTIQESAPLGLSSDYGVWYTFVGDGTSTTISTYANMDLGLLIMTGSNCSGFSQVVYMDNWRTFSTESYTFTTVNSQVYYVYIAHYQPGNTTTGTFTISRSCVTGCNTIPSTISVNLSNTVTNDVVTYTVMGGNGSVTGYEYSFNNFVSVAGTFTTTNNPFNLRLNTTQSIIYVRAITKNGTCNSVTSNIVSTTLTCATPFVYATEFGDYISNVTFNTINNTSTRDVGGDGYQNFLSLSTNVCKGFPYTISVSSRNNFGYLGYRVWIDWNNDGDFADADESVFSAGPQATATGTINVPQTAVTGSVKMRVLGVYNTTPPNTPCSNVFLDYGEIEEYTINIGTLTMSTTPVNTDMIFVGRTSNVFTTLTNWLQFNGVDYVVPTSAPISTTNVILPPNQTCASTPATIAANTIVEVKSMTIESTAELRLNGTLSVFKDFNNYGSVINTNSTSQRMLEFVGSGTQDHLIMQGNTTLYNLRVNKPNGELQLENDINVTNNLDIPSGNLRLNQKVVNLGTTGFMSNEGDGHSAYCDCPTGYIQRTITIGSNTTVTPGNMGLTITTNGNQMGTTVIKRRHQRAGSTNVNFLTSTTPSVFRIYDVSPQFNGTNYPPNGLNVNITYSYLSTEVGSEISGNESVFGVWRSGDAGTTWEDKGGVIDLNNRTITLNGFSQFSWISAGPSGEVLPLDLLSFNGINKGEYNQLNWTTDNEVNFSHFELEKSRDGYNYETLTNIPSNGLSNVRNSYSFNDNNPSQINYYRLKSIDLDGSYSYSNVIVIETKLETNTGTLYPNPTSDIIKYSFNSETNEKIEIKVLDVVGKVVLRVETELEVGNNTIPVSLSELPSGTYTIQIKHMNQMVTNSTKVIKL
jgi:hypothetical protein